MLPDLPCWLPEATASDANASSHVAGHLLHTICSSIPCSHWFFRLHAHLAQTLPNLSISLFIHVCICLSPICSFTSPPAFLRHSLLHAFPHLILHKYVHCVFWASAKMTRLENCIDPATPQQSIIKHSLLGACYDWICHCMTPSPVLTLQALQCMCIVRSAVGLQWEIILHSAKCNG